MPTYDGRLLYFRFYDPTVLEDYFDRLIFTLKARNVLGRRVNRLQLDLPKGHHVVRYAPTMEFAKITPAKSSLIGLR